MPIENVNMIARLSRSRRGRRGMTLLEVMVALAVAVGVLVVAVPTIRTIFTLEQHRAAKDLALLYQQLNDEVVSMTCCLAATGTCCIARC